MVAHVTPMITVAPGSVQTTRVLRVITQLRLLTSRDVIADIETINVVVPVFFTSVVLLKRCSLTSSTDGRTRYSEKLGRSTVRKIVTGTKQIERIS